MSKKINFAVAGAMIALVAMTAAAPQAIAQQVASRDPNAVTAGTYKVEPYHTQVTFSVSHFGFTDFSGFLSGGSGTLNFRGRSYALSAGGLDYGLVFGGSKTVLRGRVSNIVRPSDVAGVYGAAGAGLAVGRGARGIVLTNQKGAVLELAGRQTGLMANADLSGLAITLK